MRGCVLAIVFVAVLSCSLSAQDKKSDAKVEQDNALLKRVQELEAKLTESQAQLKALKATPVATISEGRAVISCVISK